MKQLRLNDRLHVKGCQVLDHSIKELFEYIFEHILGLSWKTKIYRPDDSRMGPFSICRFSAKFTYCSKHLNTGNSIVQYSVVQ